jgi:HEPN domain-containing protein
VGRWQQGAADIQRLIDARHLQQVAADVETPQALLAAAERHIHSARLAARHDHEGAYSMAYDAARKAATALLSHQGLRPTTAGGHIAVAEAVRAQFPGVPGLASLDRLRRRRNQAEYPQPRSYDPIHPDEVADAITVADQCVDSVRRLLALDQLGIF